MAQFCGKFEAGTPEWNALREGSIGGSNVAAIMGLSPWESAMTRYLKLRGVLSDQIEDNEAMRLGRLLEPGLVENFKARYPDLGVDYNPGIFSHDLHTFFHANPDALLSDNGILEIKTSAEPWDEPPQHYVLQVRWYMWIMQADYAVIAGLIGGRWREFRIERDSLAEQVMVKAVAAFYSDAITGIPPMWDGSDSTYQSMREMYPAVEDVSVELGDLGAELVEAAALVGEATARFNQVKSQVLDLMKENKYGLHNGVRVCYRQKASNGTPFLKIK